MHPTAANAELLQAVWPQPPYLSVPATLFMTKDGQFQKKEFEFIVTSVPGNRQVASFIVDLKDFAEKATTETVSLAPKTCNDRNASLSLMLMCVPKNDDNTKPQLKEYNVTLRRSATMGLGIALDTIGE
jgi:hypothetical protein